MVGVDEGPEVLVRQDGSDRRRGGRLPGTRWAGPAGRGRCGPGPSALTPWPPSMPSTDRGRAAPSGRAAGRRLALRPDPGPGRGGPAQPLVDHGPLRGAGHRQVAHARGDRLDAMARGESCWSRPRPTPRSTRSSTCWSGRRGRRRSSSGPPSGGSAGPPAVGRDAAERSGGDWPKPRPGRWRAIEGRDALRHRDRRPAHGRGGRAPRPARWTRARVAAPASSTRGPTSTPSRSGWGGGGHGRVVVDPPSPPPGVAGARRPARRVADGRAGPGRRAPAGRPRGLRSGPPQTWPPPVASTLGQPLADLRRPTRRPRATARWLALPSPGRRPHVRCRRSVPSPRWPPRCAAVARPAGRSWPASTPDRLTQALPLWLGTLADIDDLLPPSPRPVRPRDPRRGLVDRPAPRRTGPAAGHAERWSPATRTSCGTCRSSPTTSSRR